jgi:hypothetical protein
MRPKGTGTVRKVRGKWWAVLPRHGGARDVVLCKETFRHVAERKLDQWVAGRGKAA